MRKALLREGEEAGSHCKLGRTGSGTQLSWLQSFRFELFLPQYVMSTFPRKKNKILFQGNLVPTKGERESRAEKEVGRVLRDRSLSPHGGHLQHEQLYLIDKKYTGETKSSCFWEDDMVEPISQGMFTQGKQK